MQTEKRKVAIIGGMRTPFCRSGGAYKNSYSLEMMTVALQGLVQHFNLKGKIIGDVCLGAVIHHPRDWNLAREAVLGSGLAPETPGFVIQRACGTSLEASILIANKIAMGQIDVGIAGGVDSLSNPPLVYQDSLSRKILASARAKTLGGRIRPWLSLKPRDLLPLIPSVSENRTKKTMGQHCEIMAKEWKIQRADQDKLALASHQNAARSYSSEFYSDLISPFKGQNKDDNVRGDTNIEKLSRLKPAFDLSGAGTLTAGNSSPLTDGAACVLMCTEEWANSHNLPIQAYFTDCEVSAVNFVEGMFPGKPVEGLLMAPAHAVARLLKRNHANLNNFDFYEIHEAFAAQVLCTLKAWESEPYCTNQLGLSKPLGSIDRQKLNVCGGSVALGHPFGATGARLVATLAKNLHRKGMGSRGLISVCTGGAMGVAAILEA